jgi:hypothetical protein
VHHAVGGRERQAGVLRHRQRVHVAAQQHRAAALGARRAAVQHGHHRVERLSGANGQRQTMQRVEHPALGSGHLKADLRVPVDGAP